MDDPMQAVEQLRRSFDGIAELYDAVRPGYPAEVVALALAQSPRNQPRILEVGCGSGQATAAFAPVGMPILASDPSAAMITLGRQRLAAYSNIRWLVGRFEELELPETTFDLIISAQAFHWVDPAHGLPQARGLLTPGGGLVLFWNFIAYDTTPLLAHIRTICVTHAPAFAGWPEASAANLTAFAEHWQKLLQDAAGFTTPASHRFATVLPYAHPRFVLLIESFSWAQVLPPQTRAHLLTAVRETLAAAPDPLPLPVQTLVLVARREPD